MRKPITKNVHGLIDYSYSLVVPFLPEIVGFTKVRAGQILCRSLGASALVYSLLTKARWGAIRVLPFKTHLIVDFSISCIAVASPWLFGFANNSRARNTLLIAGVSGLAASLLTDSNERSDPKQRHLLFD